jgi:hypothetical protein
MDLGEMGLGETGLGEMGLGEGYRTLRHQDTSDPRHFGTSILGPKCLDLFGTETEVSSDTSASVAKCLWTLRHWYQNVFGPI